MWKYILAAFFLVIGAFELLLAFHGPLRQAILESSPALSNRVGPVAFAVIGCSALLTGIAILVAGYFW